MLSACGSNKAAESSAAAGTTTAAAAETTAAASTAAPETTAAETKTAAASEAAGSAGKAETEAAEKDKDDKANANDKAGKSEEEAEGTYVLYAFKEGDMAVLAGDIFGDNAGITFNKDGSGTISVGAEGSFTWEQSGSKIVIKGDDTAEAELKDGIITMDFGEDGTLYFAKEGADTSSIGAMSLGDTLSKLLGEEISEIDPVEDIEFGDLDLEDILDADIDKEDVEEAYKAAQDLKEGKLDIIDKD